MRMVPILELPHVFILLGFAQPGTIFPVRALRRALGHAPPMRLGATVRSYSPSAFICST